MLSDRVHGLLAGQEASSARQASNFTTHLAALAATKTADGLIDPKIVLAWLTTALGAPAYVTASLVPVRESGALLPQLALARLVQRRSQRKVVWAVGSLGQGLAALGIAAAALLLEDAAAGWAILACLALLAVSRAACSATRMCCPGRCPRGRAAPSRARRGPRAPSPSSPSPRSSASASSRARCRGLPVSSRWLAFSGSPPR